MSTRISVALTFAAVILATPLGAQDYPSRAELASREATFRRYLQFPELVRGGEVQPHWLAGGDSFWYAEGAGTGDVRIHRVDPAAGEVAPMFELARLRAVLAEALGHEPPGRGVPFETFAVYGETASFEVAGRRFEIDLGSYDLTEIPEDTDLEGRDDWSTPRIVRWSTWVGPPPFRERPSPDRRWLATQRGHDLWLRSTYDGVERQLTHDGQERFAWDFSTSRWSPDSRRLASTKVDMRGLTYSPLVHWLGPKETVEWWYYPEPGDPLPRSELYVLDVQGGDPIRIDVGDETDQNLVILGWKYDGSEAIVMRTDRGRRKLEILAADPETGTVRTIITESSETFSWIVGMRPGNDNELLWVSERDGWAHIYRYDWEGNLLGRLTSGQWPVLSFPRTDVEEGYAYFTAPAEATEIDPELGAARLYDSHLYRVPLTGGPRERLTEGIGNHAVRFSPSGDYFLDTYSTVRTPPRTELRASDGRLVAVLAEAEPDLPAEMNWSPPEEFVVKADDGETDLYGVLYKPADLDPTRKYPVIDHIYSGPQTSWAPRSFNQLPHGVFPQALAQMGFIVFIVDARGTPGRGKAYQDVVYGQLGRNEIPDHVAALHQLAEKRPYMDLERVGVFGSSWGGYFTLRAMLLRPDVYHAGVSGAPVADATQFLGHETYMGLLDENPEGYDYASNRRIADNLEGSLLFVIGTSDQNAKFAHTMTMVEALIRAGKYFDMIVLPERHHHYGYAPGARTWHERTYFVEAIRRHFVKYLMAPSTLPVTSEVVKLSAGGG